jgi:hypothetical protein
VAINPNSYGSLSAVAALAPRYTNAGDFDSNTRPTRAQVEEFINRASSTINVALAAAGFAIPITQADAKEAVAGIVIEAVVDLCHAANSAGRFFTEQALERGVSPMRAIRGEMSAWVEEQAEGLELLGATRTRASTAGILYRDTDEDGDGVGPIFQRKGFGNRFTDWTGGA